MSARSQTTARSETNVPAQPAPEIQSSRTAGVDRTRHRRGAHSDPSRWICRLYASEIHAWRQALRRTFRRNQDPKQAARLAAVALALLLAAGAGYTVQQGDTLGDIAAKNGTTVAKLAAANDLSNPNLIRVGQQLTIPDSVGSATVGQSRYTVQAGDTLAGIAQKLGTTARQLASLNQLNNPNLLRIGQDLLLADQTNPTGPPAATPAGSHVVASGETLGSIAQRYNTTVAEIAAANGITNTSTIYVGTTLVIGGNPPPAPPTVAGSGTSTHTVNPGETLGAIAAGYGLSSQMLASTNGITNVDLIRIGQVLTVPAGSGWVCPVRGAKYFNDWGFPRSNGRTHTGNDLFAPRGTPVQAPVSGQIELKTGTIGGLQVWLSGDDGVRYIGSHLDGFGQAGRVAAGDVIGYVGDTGSALGSSPHLHFEMARDGTTFNPWPSLQAAGC